jgi:hypothetical protein
MERKYWGHDHKTTQQHGPFETKEAAIAAVIAAFPNTRDVMTGWGNFGAHFDIQWTRNPGYVIPDFDDGLERD